MATLLFVDLEMLRLALTGGAVPPTVSQAPARAGMDERGQLWLETERPLPREVVVALGRLGAWNVAVAANVTLQPIGCWHELLPLQSGPMPDESGPPILLELPAHGLPAMAAELRRLGTTKMEFRWWQRPPETPADNVVEFADFFDAESYGANEFGMATLFMPSPLAMQKSAVPPDDSRVLLRVEPTPFLTLLKIAQGDLTAYVEQAPRVWVQTGQHHPTGQQIEPPDGQIVLLRAPSVWTVLDDLPFHRNLGAFPLPPAGRGRIRTDWPVNEKTNLRMRLDENDSDDPAELWVIHEQPIEQLNSWLRTVEDSQVARFEFALAEPRGRPILFLRARSSEQGLPIMLLSGLGCRPYLQMPNLFLPCGLRLSPPLQRAMAREYLAQDENRIHVLLPATAGKFVPVSIPETAFRPLAESVDYHAPAVRAWEAVSLQSLPELDSFEVSQEPEREPEVVESEKPLSTPEVIPVFEPIPLESAEEKAEPPVTRTSLLARLKKWLRPTTLSPARKIEEKKPIDKELLKALPEEPAPEAELPKHDELEERRVALEKRFADNLTSEARSERQSIWPELAGLYTQLDRPADAALCWLNAMWDNEAPPVIWYRGWLQSEKKLSRLLYDEDDLALLLEATPSPSSIRLLAAVVVWLAHDNPPPVLRAYSTVIRLLLEQQEAWLPVRAAWLAQMQLAKLAGSDVLALARTRDRLLERLAPKGLNLELDVPAFLRFTGEAGAERFPKVREWLVPLRASIQHWNEQLVKSRPPDYVQAPDELFPDREGRCTRAYIDLMLAFGLARLGEENSCREFWQSAREHLQTCHDPEHRFLLKAFGQRILQALDGKSTDGPLSAELLAELNAWQSETATERQVLARQRVDALRRSSRILESIEPNSKLAVELDRELSALTQLRDNDQLLVRVQNLLKKLPDESADRLHALDAICILAPRLGEAFARELLARFDSESAQFPEPHWQALLLEKEIVLATSFGLNEGMGERIIRLLRLFEAKLFRFALIVQKIRLAGSNSSQSESNSRRLEQMPARCLVALRRIGMTNEVKRLRVSAKAWALQGSKLSELQTEQPDTWAAALRTLLHLTGGWFGDGDTEQSLGILNAARTALQNSGTLPKAERTALACTYARALGQAPSELAESRFGELFHDWNGLYDAGPTNPHFALAPLALVDATVTAVANSDFTLGPIVRRWLDDDEFTVRQRLQRDVEQQAR
jgi:hypothetical protein